MLPVEELVDTGHGLEVLLRQPVVGHFVLGRHVPHDGNTVTHGVYFIDACDVQILL